MEAQSGRAMAQEQERARLPPHLTVACGLLMGAADSVPGVSGGTLALILGIYDRLIESIATVLQSPRLLRSKAGRERLASAFAFLVPLMVGIVVAFYLGTRLLVGPEDAPGLLRRPETARLCYGFFFGLVLASLREPWRRIRAPGGRHLLVAAITAAAAIVFTGLPHTGREPETWMLVYGGALAIGVMLLPGISGSLLLLMLGQYTTVMGAIHNRDWVRIGATALGVLLGLALFVPLLRRLLRRYHDLTLAGLTGLMAGSLRALWPWKNNYDVKLGPMENMPIGDGVTLVLLTAIAGSAMVFLLAMLERRVLAAESRRPGS